jgi:hypothetical protein
MTQHIPGGDVRGPLGRLEHLNSTRNFGVVLL